jgi:hypothetical protein
MKKYIDLAKKVLQMSEEELKKRIEYLEDRFKRQILLNNLAADVHMVTIEIIIEIQMISQRIMEIAQKEIEFESNYGNDEYDIKWNEENKK